MKHILITLFCLSGLVLTAQDNPKATFHAWVDSFGLNRGTILYPQYAWSVKTPGTTIRGFGFIASTPGERSFSNHLIWLTPDKAKWFSVHTETGGFPFHDLGFFQVGPRVNITEAVPRLKKPLARLFVTALPRFIGIRPNNILVAGATNPLKLGKIQIWDESYYRFFPKGPPYGEHWILAKFKPKSKIAFGLLYHHNGKNSYPGLGLRYSFF